MTAIIGGGVAGLTAAIRLAEKTGQNIHLFEASPTLGGRTRSFVDQTTGQWCDNGPHLLIGAYTATQRLLNDCGAAHHIQWQKSLELPLWDENRGYFHLKPHACLPLPISMMIALGYLPNHGISSAAALIKLVSKKPASPTQSVSQWLAPLQISASLIRDFIEPLCLGAMNEYPATAPALSFQRVLHESFANHQSARLGWFNQPLSKAFIEPLREKAKSLGVNIHTSTGIRSVLSEKQGVRLAWNTGSGHFSRVIFATPAWATHRLLGLTSQIQTRPITNIHLWFDRHVCLGQSNRQPLLGGIGTMGQWYFDVTSQMQESSELQHIAVVISADSINPRDDQLIPSLTHELEKISGASHPLRPVHSRVIQEKKATVLTRAHEATFQEPHRWMIDASEYPVPGDLPATIETAVQRGEQAARLYLMSQK